MLESTSLALRSPEAFKRALQASGKSIRDVARDANCSRARVGQLSNGVHPAAQASTAIAISAALDVDVRDLFSFPDGEALIQLGLIRDVAAARVRDELPDHPDDGYQAAGLIHAEEV